MPLFSIGLTTFDRTDMLAESIASVLGQTYTDFELIISNDNPARKITAESLKITDPRVRIINQENNLGEFNNMNFLLKESRGEYFTWLADDDLYNKYFLETAFNVLREYKWPECFYTSFGYVGKEDITRKYDYQEESLPGAEFLRRYLKGRYKAIGVMGIFQKAKLFQIGGLEDVSRDGKGLYCEYMLLLRASQFSYIQYVNFPLVLYRHHAEAWGVKINDIEMFDRAGKNLCVLGGQVLENNNYFLFGFLRLLQIATGGYITVLRRKGTLDLFSFSAYLFRLHEYTSGLKNRSSFKVYSALVMNGIWLICRELVSLVRKPNTC